MAATSTASEWDYTDSSQCLLLDSIAFKHGFCHGVCRIQYLLGSFETLFSKSFAMLDPCNPASNQFAHYHCTMDRRSSTGAFASLELQPPTAELVEEKNYQ